MFEVHFFFISLGTFLLERFLHVFWISTFLVELNLDEVLEVLLMVGSEIYHILTLEEKYNTVSDPGYTPSLKKCFTKLFYHPIILKNNGYFREKCRFS